MSLAALQLSKEICSLERGLDPWVRFLTHSGPGTWAKRTVGRRVAFPISRWLVDSELRRCKRAIRIFLRTAYTNERLAWLLAHARSGKLAYQSCCCLIGLSTADHALAGTMTSKEISDSRHYSIAKAFLGANEAEWAYYRLGLVRPANPGSTDEIRRRRLIPMVLAEIERRARRTDQRTSLSSLVAETTAHRGVKLPAV